MNVTAQRSASSDSRARPPAGKRTAPQDSLGFGEGFLPDYPPDQWHGTTAWHHACHHCMAPWQHAHFGVKIACGARCHCQCDVVWHSHRRSVVSDGASSSHTMALQRLGCLLPMRHTYSLPKVQCIKLLLQIFTTTDDNTSRIPSLHELGCETSMQYKPRVRVVAPRPTHSYPARIDAYTQTVC